MVAHTLRSKGTRKPEEEEDEGRYRSLKDDPSKLSGSEKVSRRPDLEEAEKGKATTHRHAQSDPSRERQELLRGDGPHRDDCSCSQGKKISKCKREGPRKEKICGGENLGPPRDLAKRKDDN
jgi:hypothetical protein